MSVALVLESTKTFAIVVEHGEAFIKLGGDRIPLTEGWLVEFAEGKAFIPAYKNDVELWRLRLSIDTVRFIASDLTVYEYPRTLVDVTHIHCVDGYWKMERL